MSAPAADALPPGRSIEVVRDEIGDELADELVDFWVDRGALHAEAIARERVGAVVCVLRGPRGEIEAVSSPYPQRVEALGGRLLWVYRSFAPSPAARAAFEPMLDAAAKSLEGDYAGGDSSPWGLCVIGGEPPAGVDPEAVHWPRSGLMLAGFTARGEQIRVRYFEDPTKPSPDYPLTRGYEITPRAEAEGLEPARIADLWLAEDALSPAEAGRRVQEVCMVGRGPEGELAGVSTAYLAYNERLRSPMWHVRVFSGSRHRKSRLGTHLNIRTREHLIDRYRSGADRRAPGIVLEIEELMFERQFPWAVWPINHFTFIGVNPNGAHVRVYWFEGARLGPGELKANPE